MYEQRLVAFIDILGFKEIIRKSENDSNLLKMVMDSVEFLKTFEVPESWNIALIEIEECAQKKNLEQFKIESNVQCSCFSDSVVVSVSCDDINVNEAASTLIANLSLLGAALIKNGILIRGGMTVGKLIHYDNGIVLGQGMIDAYELESKLAKYPRIILSSKLIEKLNYPILKKRDRYPYHQYIKRYKDGLAGFSQLRYFQVLQSWEEYALVQLTSDLAKTKNTIVTGLNEKFENPGVYEKYLWLKSEYDNLVILKDGAKEEIKAIHENTIHYPKC
ncbi:MAG: hypothetical protein D3904_03795 [Candidatus Electrothrix sp. EH2]|nr:hypothetical protein [Candidatus Electrothrix sp. EH2]